MNQKTMIRNAIDRSEALSQLVHFLRERYGDAATADFNATTRDDDDVCLSHLSRGASRRTKAWGGIA